MADEAVLTEARGRVLLITLNRPDAMNSINGALSSGLVAAIEELDTNPDYTVGVLTGNGRGFSAGMDLKAFAAGEDIGPMMDFIKNGSEKPLIGAVARVAPKGEAVNVALELADAVAVNAPLAVKASKKLIWTAADKTEEEFWPVQNSLMGVFSSNDAKEGPRAFAEKRAPEWTGT